MSNEYEYLFDRFTQNTKFLNFNEWPEYGDFSTKNTQYNIKYQVQHNSPSSRVTEYSIKVKDYHTDKDVIMLNYHADSIPFVPEQEKFFEPSWQDFTDEQLNKAIKYLTPILEMKMNPEREHYNMLIFKDRFYLGIRIPHLDEFEEKDHNLCITAYNVELDKM